MTQSKSICQQARSANSFASIPLSLRWQLGGRNMGRVGVITHRERHDGGFNIVHIKDAMDNSFATRETNVFVIGNEKPWISLPKGKGVKVRDRSASYGQ